MGNYRFSIDQSSVLTNHFKGIKIMELLKSVVGRKILMAITGQLMVLFVIVHLLGNSSIFIGPNGINSYAEHLHSLGPLVWVFRLGMLALVLVHGIYGIMVSLENSAATPSNYALKNRKRATFSSETMIWTGLLIAMFALFSHLTHGIQSFFQTMGWNNDRTQCGISSLGKAAAIFIGVVYVSIPLSIIVGILK